jgi:hypothetical protein
MSLDPPEHFGSSLDRPMHEICSFSITETPWFSLLSHIVKGNGPVSMCQQNRII